jgi:hypothetical protein
VFLAACAHRAAPLAEQCDASYLGRIAQELNEIASGERIAGTVEQTRWTRDEGAAVQRAMDLLESRERPVSESDVAILDRAAEILASEQVWDRQDDRVCGADDVTFSLYCALRRASVETLGEYQHRRTALQEVRFALEEATAGRDYEHRLRDYNNDPLTSLADVRGVIAAARERVAARLADQRAACASR